MRIRSVCRMAASVAAVVGCLVVAPWTAGQQTDPLSVDPERPRSAERKVAGAGDPSDSATEVLRAKVAIVGGAEQSLQWIDLLVSGSAMSGLDVDSQPIPGLQIDRITLENVQSLSPFFHVADLVAFGKGQGKVDVDQSVQVLANRIQEHIQQVQQMLTQDHQDRLQRIQKELDALAVEKSVAEKRRAELKQRSRGHEAILKSLEDLQSSLVGRRTVVIERQARRDVLWKVRQKLADERAKAVAESENHSDADRFVQLQLRELIDIREKQAQAAAKLAEQGIGPATDKEDAMAQLVDAKLQLAKFEAGREQQSPEVLRLDQRLTEVMRDLETAEIDIETDNLMTDALNAQLADMEKRAEEVQPAMMELEEVDQRLDEIGRSAAELKQSLANTRRSTAEGTPVRIRPLNGMPDRGGEEKR